MAICQCAKIASHLCEACVPRPRAFKLFYFISCPNGLRTASLSKCSSDNPAPVALLLERLRQEGSPRQTQGLTPAMPSGPAARRSLFLR
jgi:hypothetical protein